MTFPRTTLEQWRSLQAVVEQGGYVQAAEVLHRSQSAVSYNVQRLQQNLGIALLEIQGRRAVLTKDGKTLLRHANRLLSQAKALEVTAQQLGAGWEAEINLVVDAAFPTEILMRALELFAPQDRGTRVNLQEVVLSGGKEALQSGDADIVISDQKSNQSLSDVLISIDFIAVAHPQHPLHLLNRSLQLSDLQRETQIVIRDSGQQHPLNSGWLGADHRWTVSSPDSVLSVLQHGLGYAWLPQHYIEQAISHQQLKILPLQQGQCYTGNLHLYYGKPDNLGPATCLLAQCLRDAVVIFDAE